MGPAGPQGPPGVAGLVRRKVTVNFNSTESTMNKIGAAMCAPDEKVLWGGYELPTTGNANTGGLAYSVWTANASGEPIGDSAETPRGWSVGIHRDSQTGGTVRVHVMCADIG